MGWGTVFSIQPNGSNFMLLHNFTGKPDGGNPYGALLLSGTTLCGTTYAGGVSNNGSVFAVQTGGAGYTNLYSFTNYNNGAYPAAGLVLSGTSDLYGPVEEGGAPVPAQSYYPNRWHGFHFDVHSFVTYSSGGFSYKLERSFPLAGMIASDGAFYGAAYAGSRAGLEPCLDAHKRLELRRFITSPTGSMGLFRRPAS